MKLHHLALAGALALVCAPASANEMTDVYLASLGQRPASVGSIGRPLDLVSTARRHVGATARDLRLPRSLWCGDFVNLVRREAGLSPVPSRLARDQQRGGVRLSRPRVGAIVVLSRGRSNSAGHTGIISGELPNGDLVVVSGNHNRHVSESVYPRSRVIAIVDPS